MVVEKGNHGGVLFHRDEHVGEATGEVRSDGFVLQRARQSQQLGLIRGDGEMIRPEMHQAFGEGRVGERGALGACQYLLAVMRQVGSTHQGAFLHIRAFIAGRQELRDDLFR